MRTLVACRGDKAAPVPIRIEGAPTAAGEATEPIRTIQFALSSFGSTGLITFALCAVPGSKSSCSHTTVGLLLYCRASTWWLLLEQYSCELAKASYLRETKRCLSSQMPDVRSCAYPKRLTRLSYVGLPCWLERESYSLLPGLGHQSIRCCNSFGLISHVVPNPWTRPVGTSSVCRKLEASVVRGSHQLLVLCGLASKKLPGEGIRIEPMAYGSTCAPR